MAENTQMVKSSERVKEIRSLLGREDMMKEFTDALPKHLTVERMIRVGMTALQKTPDLLLCSQRSIVGSIIQACQLGLEPDGVLGHAYLIPFNNKKTQQKEATLMIGYRGLIDLAFRSGRVSSISSEIVHMKDEFHLEAGTNRHLRHIPYRHPVPGEMRGDPDEGRGEPIGAYAVVKFKDGATDYEFLTMDQLDILKSRAQAANSGPWGTHWDEMARKSAIRKLAKRLPLSPELTKAAVMDEYHEGGIVQPVITQREADTGETSFPGEELDAGPKILMKYSSGRIYLSGHIDLVAKDLEDLRPQPNKLRDGQLSLKEEQAEDVFMLCSERGILVVEHNAKLPSPPEIPEGDSPKIDFPK